MKKKIKFKKKLKKLSTIKLPKLDKEVLTGKEKKFISKVHCWQR